MPLSVTWEGGGSRGIANGGVYTALEHAGLLNQITCAGGASIGALFALFTALRVPAQQVVDKVLSINLRDFVGDRRPGKFDASVRYLTQWGIFSPDPLFVYVRNVIAEQLTHITGTPSHGMETLQQIYQIHKCHLLTTVTNISTGKCVELNDVDHPNVPAYFAVALSMVIPLVFIPVKWNGHYWVDGGIANGLPYAGVKRLSDLHTTILVFAFDNDSCSVPAAPTNLTRDQPAIGQTTTLSSLRSSSMQPQQSRQHLQYQHLDQSLKTHTTPSSLTSFVQVPQQQQQHPHYVPQEQLRTSSSNQVENIVDYIASLFQTLNASRGLATFMHEFGCYLPNVLLVPTPGVTSLTLTVDLMSKQLLIDQTYQRTMTFLQSLMLL